MAGKIPNMVAEAERKDARGRPRKVEKGAPRVQVLLPDDLCVAARRMMQERKLNFHDAIRELVREAAEARGFVEPRN